MLFCITSAFSQKLWEIEVNPDDMLRDVTEIANSDLLLFTYNTGKLEIRRSGDGSLVKNVTTPQGELGSYSISGLGNSYYFSERGDYKPEDEATFINDTIFVYDLLSDEIINKISINIDGHSNEDNLFSKKYKYTFTPDMTKMYGRIEYLFKEPVVENYKNYYNKYYFYVYDLIQDEIIHYERCHIAYTDEQGRNFETGFYLDSYRSSPDSKYIILNGREFSGKYNDDSKGVSKIFSLEEFKDKKVFYSDNEGVYYEYFSLLYGKIENDFISFLDPIIFIKFSFPDFERVTNLNFHSMFGIYSANNANFYLCNEDLFFISGEKVPGGGSQDYRYWQIKINIQTNELIFNSKEQYTFKNMFNSFVINDCNKIIIPNDFDNRVGIIACYNYNTLDIESPPEQSNYFQNTESKITFNSQEFIGQIANIEVYNSTGSKVGILHNGIINQPNYNLQIPELPSGAYYLQCQLPNQNLNFNFVVVK